MRVIVPACVEQVSPLQVQTSTAVVEAALHQCPFGAWNPRMATQVDVRACVALPPHTRLRCRGPAVPEWCQRGPQPHRQAGNRTGPESKPNTQSPATTWPALICSISISPSTPERHGPGFPLACRGCLLGSLRPGSGRLLRQGRPVSRVSTGFLHCQTLRLRLGFSVAL